MMGAKMTLSSTKVVASSPSSCTATHSYLPASSGNTLDKEKEAPWDTLVLALLQ
jgi:hypothetical protein